VLLAPYIVVKHVIELYRAKQISVKFMQIAQKLSYTSEGYQKSLIKYLDKYFWLRFSDNLPIPPKWVPTEQFNRIQPKKE